MKKPWNIPDLPVYSIATQRDGQVNMNICTYVSAVSMTPKRYAVAIYYNTQTLENVLQNGEFVLQLLSDQQAPAVRNFGQKSGKSFDKHGFLQRKNTPKTGATITEETYELHPWNSFQVLKHAVALIHLKVIQHHSAGDHELFLCDVVGYKVQNTQNPLTINKLRELKLVRM
jgi:flavin reductase (DIM6/NTAB) family NADH-FMN oxidoreductase RutF